MRAPKTILLCLFVISVITGYIFYPISISYSTPSIESISQYIIYLSKEIRNSIQISDESIIANSKGKVKLKLFLSPLGEMKDAYVSESSGSEDLDNLLLEAVRLNGRYQVFPEELGEEELWIEVPIIFRADGGERNFSDHNLEYRKVDPPLFSSKTEQGGRRKSPESYSRKAIFLSVSDIGGAVDAALENHIAAKIAEEEIELSKLKVREARRVLYPSANLEYLETIGKTAGLTQNFTDKEYKLKFEYPLYYGWRLKYAVEQAIANMKASRHNYDSVLQDLRLEVELAFYAYIVSKSNLILQRELLSEAGEIFDKAKKRFDAGLVTQAEFLQVTSQREQVAYQVTSGESQMAMAGLSLSQAMNVGYSEDSKKYPKDLEEIIDIDINIEDKKIGMDFDPPEINMTLEECMDMAFRYRSDLMAKGYMVDFSDYERKIAKTKDQLKVDLTGSYGKSGGAYESETLNMSKDWFIGVKVSKPLGGNTLSTAYTKEETSEKHGQTSRVESMSKSVTLGLLDNLQSFSEKKSSEIALKKANEELQKVKDNVVKEVREAYLNYKKGLIQIESNLKKIRYKEEELKVAKARAELNEMPFSELLRVHIELTDERSFYIEAVGTLYQSLARLNKATGYALFLDDKGLMLANVNGKRD